MSEYVSCGISILVSKQIVKHYHPEELLHLWHPCRHELPDGISYLRIVSVVFEITVSFFRSFKYKHPDGIHAANHLQHTEEIALVRVVGNDWMKTRTGRRGSDI